MTAPTAFWDVTGDNLPDLNPTAIFVGGVSGTHRAAQLYFENDGTTPLALPYDAVLTMSAGGQVLGTYFAAAGTALSNAASWTGPQATMIAANYSGTATHTSDADFAKLTFAGMLGYTYSNARVIQVKIQALKNGELSQNSGAFLFMGINLSTGNLFGNRDIDIYGGIIYSSNFVAENTVDQGITNIRIDNTWSKNNMRNQINTAGVNARTFADTASPTGFSVVYAKALATAGDRTKLYRSKIESFDIDGFPNYGTEEDINGTGASPGPANSGPSSPCVIPQLFSGGMPVIAIGKTTSTRTASILVNQGTAASPDYTPFVRAEDIEPNLEGITLMRADSAGKLYMPRGGAGPVGQLYRVTYSGVNNNATALATSGNWASEEIGATAITIPAANGNGQTFQGRCFGVAIDNDTTVNSEPVVYVTDNTNHVIWQVTRNASAFGDGRDWDWVIFAGTSGVAGNVDGIGLAAQFNTPTGIVCDGAGALYVNDSGSRTMRKITISTADVVTFFGVDGIGAHVDQFPF